MRRCDGMDKEKYLHNRQYPVTKEVEMEEVEQQAILRLETQGSSLN